MIMVQISAVNSTCKNQFINKTDDIKMYFITFI